jgi:hypothetical protein
MARFVDLQTNFSTGELDPLLRARVDLEQYNNALAKATNVVVQPQGGIKRRPGSKYIYELPSSAANGVRMVPFEFSVLDSYMLVFVHQRMYIFKNGALVTNINASGNDFLAITALTSAMLPQINWTQSADTLIVVHPDLPPITIVRGASDSAWTVTSISFNSIPDYAFTLTVTNPAGTITPGNVSGNTTITASNNVFSAGNVGQYINAIPQGRAQIVRFNSATSVDVIVEFPFFNTATIANNNWDLETGYEPVWSNTRGWPRAVTFHEGRLFFGGSKSRPSTVWGSKIGLYFDFKATEAFDDDAVEAILDTNQLNVIVDMISGRDMQVFTTGGEFFVPQAGTDPITPATFIFKAVSRHGMKPGTVVEPLESGTLFIQRQGKALNEFLFSDSQLTYVTQRISLLCGHLLKGPSRIALRRATGTDEGDLLLIVNADDGGMAVFSLLRSQQVVAPSEFLTDGQYLDIGVDVTDIYTVVKRRFGTSDKYLVERFDEALFTDCAFTGAAASGASSLPHEDKELDVLCDGAVQNKEVVTSGAITFQRPSLVSFECGLPIPVLAKTMPVELRLQTGSRLTFKKRIVQINAIVNQSQHMNLNGQFVPFRNFGSNLLDEPVPEFTGVKRLDGVRGYDREIAIEITQDKPLKLNLLGLDYKVAVHQGT